MKNFKFTNFTKKVLSYIDCNSKTRKLIMEDLYSNLLIKFEETGENDPVKLMGKPEKVAKEFIEKNNGKIWIESEDGQGTLVYLSVLKSNTNWIQ